MVVVIILFSPIWVPFVVVLAPVWLVSLLLWTLGKGVVGLVRKIRR